MKWKGGAMQVVHSLSILTLLVGFYFYFILFYLFLLLFLFLFMMKNKERQLTHIKGLLPEEELKDVFFVYPRIYSIYLYIYLPYHQVRSCGTFTHLVLFVAE